MTNARDDWWDFDPEFYRAVHDSKRVSDRSGEAIETTKIGSTEGESAGPKDNAQKEAPGDNQ